MSYQSRRQEEIEEQRANRKAEWQEQEERKRRRGSPQKTFLEIAVELGLLEQLPLFPIG